ncbi:hypothetical protein MYP_2626 [Sporocytophaga myxococcoides]|uniref:Uncharacterized protein n=1 Tax=Sporocytophaga myxococcoides TaxID=153721 RepID=A0A098LG34_9BACT|nr:DUF1232 domain-containing protein [Sporocytophaga myxococcoides]GAL85397.1 hypothetical protein MYP_2626 [Sporocytophaga myxococcoides]
MKGFGSNGDKGPIDLDQIKTEWIKKLISFGTSFTKGAHADALKEVVDKFYDPEAKRFKFEVISREASLAKRMLKAVLKGEYRNVSPFLLIQVGLVFSYFYFDIDFISDKIPLLGAVDDIAVILWLMDGFKDELDKFEVWESERSIRLA